jgi:hypothetical protein
MRKEVVLFKKEVNDQEEYAGQLQSKLICRLYFPFPAEGFQNI